MRQLRRLGVPIHLGMRIDTEQLVVGGYEAVIAATGATEHLPTSLGADRRTVGAADVLGKRAPHVDSCVVFDDSVGAIGMTVAEWLLARGARVVLATSAIQIGASVVVYSHRPHLERLLKAGATLMTQVQLHGWEGDQVVLKHALTNEALSVRADLLVFVDARRSEDRIAKQYASAGGQVQLAGDAIAPRDVMWSVWEGRAADLSTNERLSAAPQRPVHRRISP